MKKWEYQFANIDKGVKDALIALGAEGWRLVPLQPFDDRSYMLMEREIPEPKAQHFTFTYKVLEAYDAKQFESLLNVWGTKGYEVQEASAAKFRAVLRKRKDSV